MRGKKFVFLIVLSLFLAGVLNVLRPHLNFSRKCLRAEKEMTENFRKNKETFQSIASKTADLPPISFKIRNQDTVSISIVKDQNLAAWTDTILFNAPNERYYFGEKGCAWVMREDTVKVCAPNWEFIYSGPWQDDQLLSILDFYGWEKSQFDWTFEQVQKLNCSDFTKGEGFWGMRFRTVSYYDDGKLHCNGHHDGYFDYVYTENPDQFSSQISLHQLEGNFYAIRSWKF